MIYLQAMSLQLLFCYVGYAEEIMSTAIPYQVAVAQDEIVVRLDRTLFEAADLTELLDYLRLKVIRRQSQLTEAEIAELADEINHRRLDFTG
jgi:hypothetical protein